MESCFENRLADLLVIVWELMAGLKVDLKTGWLISLSLCESWWLDGKLIWRQAGWSHCLCVRAAGWMESWFEDRLADLIVFVLEVVAWWKIDWKTGWLISVFMWELMARWKIDWKTGWLICLISLFFCDLMAWWKVDLKTGWLISLSLWESWWLDGKLIWRQTGWSPFLCVRADGWMESWFGDRLADLFVFVWELMAWWKVDLKTDWMISFSLCESWWLDGKLIWRQAGWSPCLCVRAYCLMESCFENRLADLLVIVWELMAGWKVDLKTGWLISLSLCESCWLDGKLIWRQAGWSHCLCVRDLWLDGKLIGRQAGWSLSLCES